MDYHYRAFISYRHSPKDIKVATEVQRRLERYHIPRSLQKKLGIKKMGRIFRDKDELSTASDLNDTIKAALENAEYLIVICSTQSIKSIWVQREIDFFLQSHDRYHVLTVLVDGEPGEVIPKVLCEGTVETVTEDGEKVEVKVPLEPLSCDYRFGRHKARKEELPRLAAALLGCSYDALRQRQKQYQMRVMAAAITGLLALSGYFLWSNVNIRENYNQSLRNQSRYLSSASLELLDSNNRILATQLALSALPSEEMDRPVVPEAQYALARAVDAYTVPATLNIATVSRFQAEEYLNRYLVNKAGDHIALADGQYQIKIYNAMTGDLLKSHRLEDSIKYVEKYDEDSFIVMGSSTLSCFAWENGEMLWSQEYDDAIRSGASIEEGTEPDYALLLREDLLILEGGTRNILKRLNYEEYLKNLVGQEKTAEILECSISAYTPEDKSAMYMLYYNVDFEGGSTVYHVEGILEYDTFVGEFLWHPIDLEAGYISHYIVTEDGKVYVSYVADGELPLNWVWKTTGVSTTYGNYEPGQVQYSRIDLATGQIEWTHTMNFTGGTSYQRALLRPYTTEESFGEIKEVLAVFASNVCEILDLETGELLRRYEYPAEIVSVLAQKSIVSIFLGDGDWAYNDWEDNSIDFVGGFVGQLESAEWILASETEDQCAHIFLESNDTIYMYETKQGDKQWTAMEGEILLKGVFGSSAQSEHYFAVEVSNTVFVYDLETKTQKWAIQEERIDYSTVCLGFSEDEKYLYLSRGTSAQKQSQMVMVRLNLEDGTLEEVPLFSQQVIEDYSWNILSEYVLYKEKLYNIARHSYNLEYLFYLCCYSLETGELTRTQLPIEDIANLNLIQIDASNGKAWIIGEDGSGYTVDISSGETEVLKEQLPLASYGIWNEAMELWALQSSVENEIWICKPDGSCIAKIDCLDMTAASMHFYNGELLVFYESGNLYRYDEKTGVFKGRLEVENTDKLSYDVVEWQFVDENTLMLFMQTSMAIIDTQNWGVTAYLPITYGYCASENIMMIPDTQEKYVMGYCPYYSLEELIDKGKELVGNAVFTEEQRSEYGLE